jgi:hypothetical protein
MPVSGPPGTPAEYIQADSGVWEAIDMPPRTNDPGSWQTGPLPDGGPLPPARHSLDFRSVHWFGTEYHFNEAQAAVVAVLWEAWENETPDVGHRTLLDKAGVAYDRLPDLFKVKGEYVPAWNTMIKSNVGSKGSARLCAPDMTPS